MALLDAGADMVALDAYGAIALVHVLVSPLRLIIIPYDQSSHATRSVGMPYDLAVL
jgi:hypothetical protein